MTLKITTWNIEHAGKLIADPPSKAILNRRGRVKNTIDQIDPDILCLQEGPKGEEGIIAFASEVLENGWSPILLHEREGTRPNSRAYHQKGTQWIWFLVRAGLEGRCALQSPGIWQAFTASTTWPVHFWGQEEAMQHSHYRHPQVLAYDTGNNQTIEFIGVHLKSKINRERIIRDDDGNLIGPYVNEAIKARIKLATEARNVRQYITSKFNQIEHPHLVILGDCNDGPGQDYFENAYLFFDLVSNLQGDMILAEQFFIHALIVDPPHLRWTARFRDEVLGIPASKNPLLLDHILLSRSLVDGTSNLRIDDERTKVEHEAYEIFNANCTNSTRTSDHRPVSLVLRECT
ncbi:endonuclease/exonuclease/phosphatase family metal-dependent hydrolase [Methanofollis sp. W23]|uniref:endonuclease/exonuclease/phosphatase family protein n=1 Tax=Methanofollis sp. W23 TaxID=2817849 RepID=UPI001AE2EBA6|nr:hypothetical protein [Methanofollis sp. W23]MBP2147164.1 endonuclease/exonuclease/phosphatase family metal-dependent hydrolase [Methanofollis sp. W23]